MIIDRLIDKCIETDNPSVIGLDTALDYLPDDVRRGVTDLTSACAAIKHFNYRLIDALYQVVPAVKVQVAYYESYGWEGMKVFKETVDYARSRGLIAISDVKRNDIGSTAAAYSRAYIGANAIGGNTFTPFETDFITVNGYLGSDGINPFLDDCKQYDKGMFVLVKTSNPTSGELQNKVFKDGETLYGTMGAFVEKWGERLVGRHGYSSVGAVVGATHSAEAAEIRKACPHTFFLIPGYGAQGGGAEQLSVCFRGGIGGIVNNSRGILCAYKKERYKGMDYAEAALAEALAMKEDLNRAIKK